MVPTGPKHQQHESGHSPWVSLESRLWFPSPDTSPLFSLGSAHFPVVNLPGPAHSLDPFHFPTILPLLPVTPKLPGDACWFLLPALSFPLSHAHFPVVPLSKLSFAVPPNGSFPYSSPTSLHLRCVPPRLLSLPGFLRLLYQSL